MTIHLTVDGVVVYNQPSIPTDPITLYVKGKVAYSKAAPPVVAGLGWSPTNASSHLTLSNGNRTVTHKGDLGGLASILMNAPITKPAYWEIKSDQTSVADDFSWGVGLASMNLNSYCGDKDSIAVSDTGVIVINGTFPGGGGGTLHKGDTVGIYVDPVRKLFWYWFSSTKLWNNNAAASPTTGVGGISFAALSGVVYPAMGLMSNGSAATVTTMPPFVNPVIPVLATRLVLSTLPIPAPVITPPPPPPPVDPPPGPDPFPIGTVVTLGASDNVGTVQSKLNSVPAGGSLVFPGGSTYNFGGQTVRGKAGITVYANGVVTINGAPGNGSNGAFDFGGLSNWTIRGRAPGAGFVFNGSLINASGAASYAVGNCVFNNQNSNGFDGSAIRQSGSSNGLVINNDFNGCGGNVCGMYDVDKITFDGNHFVDSYQPWSFNFPNTPTLTLGRDLIFRRNVIIGARRAVIEIGPSSEGSEYTSGLVVDNNFFDDFNNDVQAGQGTLLPISLVAQSAVNTTVTNNFIRRGPRNNGLVCIGIEFTGSGECAHNVIWDMSYTIMTYQSGWNVHDNTIYNGSGPSFGTLNNGHGSGTFGPENIVSSPPPVPPWPTRTSW